MNPITVYVPPATLATSNGPRDPTSTKYTYAYFANRAEQTRESCKKGIVAPKGQSWMRRDWNEPPPREPKTEARKRRRSLTLSERLSGLTEPFETPTVPS